MIFYINFRLFTFLSESISLNLAIEWRRLKELIREYFAVHGEVILLIRFLFSFKN